MKNLLSKTRSRSPNKSFTEGEGHLGSCIPEMAQAADHTLSNSGSKLLGNFSQRCSFSLAACNQQAINGSRVFATAKLCEQCGHCFFCSCSTNTSWTPDSPVMFMSKHSWGILELGLKINIGIAKNLTLKVSNKIQNVSLFAKY